MHRCILVGIFVFLLSACATDRDNYVPITQAVESKALVRENNEILVETEQMQQYLVEQQAFLDDPVLHNYIESLARPMIDDLNLSSGQKITFKILREPTINAMAMLNGHIYFHSGLFARLDDQDTLAFVIAHEISHYFHRDVLYQVQNLKRKTVTFKLLDLLITPPASLLGGGGLTSLGLSLMYAGSMSGYSRGAEAAADEFALEKMLKAGHDPRDATKFFDAVMSEKDRYLKGLEIFFLSSHPSAKKRKAFVENWLTENETKVNAKKDLFERPDPFLEKTHRMLMENARLNLDVDRYFHALDDLEKAKKVADPDPQVFEIEGDTYHWMAEKRYKIKDELSKKKWKEIDKEDEEAQIQGWQEKSKKAYQKALELAPQSSRPFKGLGRYHMTQKNYDEAEKYFNRYLQKNPNAKDTRSVKRYLRDIQELKIQEVRTV